MATQQLRHGTLAAHRPRSRSDSSRETGGLRRARGCPAAKSCSFDQSKCRIWFSSTGGALRCPFSANHTNPTVHTLSPGPSARRRSCQSKQQRKTYHTKRQRAKGETVLQGAGLCDHPVVGYSQQIPRARRRASSSVNTALDLLAAVSTMRRPFSQSCARGRHLNHLNLNSQPLRFFEYR